MNEFDLFSGMRTTTDWGIDTSSATCRSGMPRGDGYMVRLLLVGRDGSSHLGGSFLRACEGFRGRIQAELVDGALAASSSVLWSKLSYHFLRRPFPNARRFNEHLMARCGEFNPHVMICLGDFPVSRAVLDECRRRKMRTGVFLTDDPWNPGFLSEHLLSVVKHYDVVFTPRRANLAQLRAMGCRSVQYLPFGYDPELFRPVAVSEAESQLHGSDVMFAGGGDADRLPFIAALSDAGFDVGLYGGYWDRFPETRSLSRGLAGIEVLRTAIAASKVALCLVRRANRDGHVMRTFEVPAVGACMLTEDTPEHREIFGDDGRHVVYFSGVEDMVERCRWLLSNPSEATRLRASVHRLISEGANTYGDRLDRMLRIISDETAFPSLSG